MLPSALRSKERNLFSNSGGTSNCGASCCLLLVVIKIITVEVKVLNHSPRKTVVYVNEGGEVVNDEGHHNWDYGQQMDPTVVSRFLLRLLLLNLRARNNGLLIRRSFP